MATSDLLVVFVHGRATFGAESARTAWLNGVNQGLTAIGARPLHRSEALYVDYSEYLEQLAGAIGNRTSLPPKVLHDMQSGPEAGEPGVPVLRCQDCLTTGLRNTVEERYQLARGVAAHRLGAVGLKAMRDVLRYLGHASARVHIRGLVEQQIPDDRPIVLIGHSLGSLVALDAITSGVVAPIQLITAGTPVSVPAVRDVLTEEFRTTIRNLETPWLNVFDPGDEVTGGKWVRKHISSGVQNWHVDNGSRPHRAERYLRHQPVADTVSAWIKSHGR